MAVADVHWSRLVQVFVHPYRAYLGLHRRFGDTIRTRVPGGAPLYFTIDDEWIDHVLVRHPQELIRPRELVDSIFVPTVGANVVASNGDTWATKRAAAETLLDTTAWSRDGDPLAQCVDEFAGELAALAGGGIVDLLPAIERFVLAAATRLVCGREPPRDGGELAKALAFVMRATQELGDVRKRAFLYAIVPRAQRLVDGRRLAAVGRAVAVISRFEPDAGRRELLLATYENPSTTLTWTLRFLAANPEARAAIRTDNVDDLAYTEAALREAARLRPAIAYLVREAETATTIDGLELPPGTSVAIVPYCVHQDERRWPDPNRYDPARFLDGAEHPIRHRFLAFGVGRRACVGTRFAMRILKTALARVARDFDWTSSEPLPEPSGRFPWSEKVACPVTLSRAAR